jgi:hypothetical protein
MLTWSAIDLQLAAEYRRLDSLQRDDLAEVFEIRQRDTERAQADSASGRAAVLKLIEGRLEEPAGETVPSQGESGSVFADYKIIRRKVACFELFKELEHYFNLGRLFRLVINASRSNQQQIEDLQRLASGRFRTIWKLYRLLGLLSPGAVLRRWHKVEFLGERLLSLMGVDRTQGFGLLFGARTFEFMASHQGMTYALRSTGRYRV